MIRFGLPGLLLLAGAAVAVILVTRNEDPPSPLAPRITVDASTSLSAGLYIIDLADSSGWRIEAASGGAWSPDGTLFAYNRVCEQPCGFGLVNVSSGQRIEVGGGNVAAIAWSPDSDYVAYSFREPAGEAGTYFVPTDGKNPERVSEDAADELAWADETHVAIVSGQTRSAIDIDSHGTVALNEDGPLDELDSRLIFGKRSPDGNFSAYSSDNGVQVWRKDGSLLMQIPGPLPGVDWSGDGGQLLFDEIPQQSYPRWSLLNAGDLSQTVLTGVGLGAGWLDDRLIVSTNLFCGGSPPVAGAAIQVTDIASGVGTVLASGVDAPIAGALIANQESRQAVYVSLSQGSPTLELVSSGSTRPLAVSDGGFDLVPGMFSRDGRFLAVVVGSGRGICD